MTKSTQDPTWYYLGSWLIFLAGNPLELQSFEPGGVPKNNAGISQGTGRNFPPSITARKPGQFTTVQEGFLQYFF